MPFDVRRKCRISSTIFWFTILVCASSRNVMFVEMSQLGDQSPISTTIENGKMADWNGTISSPQSASSPPSITGRTRDRTAEERVRILLIQQDILRRLGMVGRVPTIDIANFSGSPSSSSPPINNAEIRQEMIAAAATPTKSSPVVIENANANNANNANNDNSEHHHRRRNNHHAENDGNIRYNRDSSSTKIFDYRDSQVNNGDGPSSSSSSSSSSSRNLISGSPKPTAVTDINEYATAEIYSQRLQSFFPSCGIPNFTEPSVWKQPNQREMRMYFDVTIPKSSAFGTRTRITIMWAKLRMNVFAAPECVTNDDEQTHVATDANNIDRASQSKCVNQITISLFQYIRPLRKNLGEQRRMVENRTVPATFRGSIEFNLHSVIDYWRNNANNNYGLVVNVEDAKGNPLPPALHLQQMNCSDHEIPIPNLADLYGDMVMLNATGLMMSGANRSRHYPTLDLMSMESEKDEDSNSNDDRHHHIYMTTTTTKTTTTRMVKRMIRQAAKEGAPPINQIK